MTNKQLVHLTLGIVVLDAIIYLVDAPMAVFTLVQIAGAATWIWVLIRLYQSEYVA